MANPTMLKFGYPDTLVREWDHWALLLRPTQVTLGSLVLAATGSATAYSDLPDGAFAEQAVAVRAIETALKWFCNYERINYLMLMMVDPHVHFHVIPRYSQARSFLGIEFPDTGWPGPPDLKSGVGLGSGQVGSISKELRRLF